MKTTKLSIEANNMEITNATASFCPFGILDMQTAVNAALQAGKNTDFVYESVNEFAESCGVTIDKCDPVYCVLDSILQEARNEITEVCNFDFVNDIQVGHIETYGNFICSIYDVSEEAKEELIKVLATNNIDIDEFSEATQYFLNATEISQDEINAVISQLLNAETE